jgi:hypothetical protein
MAMSVGVTWKVMLRRRGHRAYHYAAIKRSRREPKTGEPISVRDIDGKLVKATIGSIAREQSGRSRRALRAFIIEADEVET